MSFQLSKSRTISNQAIKFPSWSGNRVLTLFGFCSVSVSHRADSPLELPPNRIISSGDNTLEGAAYETIAQFRGRVGLRFEPAFSSYAKKVHYRLRPCSRSIPAQLFLLFTNHSFTRTFPWHETWTCQRSVSWVCEIFFIQWWPLCGNFPDRFTQEHSPRAGNITGCPIFSTECLSRAVPDGEMVDIGVEYRAVETSDHRKVSREQLPGPMGG
jgi:hypothetical protein